MVILACVLLPRILFALDTIIMFPSLEISSDEHPAELRIVNVHWHLKPFLYTDLSGELSDEFTISDVAQL
jgi:hypothetical protein